MSDSTIITASSAVPELACATEVEVAFDPDAPSDLCADSAVVDAETDEYEVESHPHSPDDEVVSGDDDGDDNLSDVEEAIDSLVDDKIRSLENFLIDLEARLVSGHSILAIRMWARKAYGIDKKNFYEHLNVVRGTWRLEGTTLFVIQTRRDEYRAMYREVYREALAGSKREDGIDPRALAVSLKAVDAMSQLDGLMSPEINVQINQLMSQDTSTAQRVEITNKMRERTQELMQKMRDRAVQHSAMATRAIQDSGPKDNARSGSAHSRSREGTADDPLVVPSSMVMGAVK